MLSNSKFTGVGVVSMPWTLHVAAPTAHYAFEAHAYASAGAAAAITPPQRKRRNATATGASVNRGTT